MRQFILMRHAQAAGPQPGQGDAQRPLTPKGLAGARAAAEALAAGGRAPDLVLTSSARRTRETWQAMSAVLGTPRVRTEDRLYNAGAETLRRFLEDAETQCETLLMIAHNPGVQFLALELLEEGAASQAARDALAHGFSPGQAILFSVDAAGRCLYEGAIQPGGGS